MNRATLEKLIKESVREEVGGYAGLPDELQTYFERVYPIYEKNYNDLQRVVQILKSMKARTNKIGTAPTKILQHVSGHDRDALEKLVKLDYRGTTDMVEQMEKFLNLYTGALANIEDKLS